MTTPKTRRRPADARDAASNSDFFDPSKPQVRRSMLFFALGALIGLVIAGYGLFTAKGTQSHSVPPEDLALVNSRPVLRSDFMTQVQTQFSVPFAQSSQQQRRRVLEDMLAEELQVQRGLEIDLPSFDPDVRSRDGGRGGTGNLGRRAGPTAHRSAAAHVLRRAPRQVHEPGATASARPGGQERLRRTAGGDGAACLVPIDKVMQRYRLEDSRALLDAGQVDTGEVFEFAAKAKLGAEVYAAAAILQAGQVSDPIPQSDGVHVVVMVEHRMPLQEDYAAAADKVWNDFKNDAQAQVREAEVRYLRSRADILLSPEARALEGSAP